MEGNGTTRVYVPGCNDSSPQLIMEEADMIDKYTTPFIYAIGFPGNIISLVVWMQKRMRHSSGYYLAALALDDLLFLIFSLFFELQVTWHIKTLDFPVLCQMYPVLYLSSQFLSPFLVLAFTTERYISICHPFKREKFCTIRRAKIVIVFLIVFILCLNAANGYIYTLTFNHETNKTECAQRASTMEGSSASIYTVYNLCVESLAFLVVPGSVLVLNILVIREMRRLSRVEHAQLHGASHKTGSTTVMLLAVSFYQIFTTLPVSIVYNITWEFNYFSNCPIYGPEKAAERHRIYHLILQIVKEYGITHYAFNIFIYIITGKMFRQELKRLFLRPFTKIASSLPREYTSLRTSVRTSGKTKTWASTNGKHADNEKTNCETLL